MSRQRGRETRAENGSGGTKAQDWCRPEENQGTYVERPSETTRKEDLTGGEKRNEPTEDLQV